MASDVLINADGEVTTIDRDAALDSCNDACGCSPPPCPSRRARRIQFHPDFPECDRWVCVDSHDTVTGARLDEVSVGTTINIGCRCYYVSDDYADDIDTPPVSFTTDDARECEDCWTLGNPCQGQGRVVFGDGTVHETPPKMYFQTTAFCTCALFNAGACYQVEANGPTLRLAELPADAYRVAGGLEILDSGGIVVGGATRIESGQCCDCVTGCTHRSAGFQVNNGCDELVDLQCCCSGDFRATETLTGWCRVWVTGDNNGQCVRVLYYELQWTVVQLATVLVEDGIVYSVTPGIIRVTGQGLRGGGLGYDPIDEERPYGFDGISVGDAYSACPPSTKRVFLCGGDPRGDPTCVQSCGSNVSCNFSETTHSYSCPFAADAGGCAGQTSYEGYSNNAVVVERVGPCDGGCPGTANRSSGQTGIGVLDAIVGGV